MNILILSDIEAGGEWIATQTLIEKLKKKDKSLKFFLISSTKNKHLLNEPIFEKIIYLDDEFSKKPFKRYRELFYKISSGKKAVHHMYKICHFDRVITTNYILALSFMVSRKKGGYIYLFHGIRNNYKIFSETLDHYLISKKILEVFAWNMSKDLIIPVPSVRNVLIEHSLSTLKNKTMIVFPNLLRDEFKNNDKNIKKTKMILYSGRLAFDKGVENLINAFLLLAKKDPKLFLTIAYPGEPEITFLKKIRAIVGKTKNIILIDNPSIKELSFLYQTTSLAVLPSPFEISSLFIREAIMCGLPILSTATGDTNKILTKQFILKDNDIDTIQNKINEFFKNTDKYQKQFSIVSDRFKSQYDKGKIVRNWLDFLRDI